MQVISCLEITNTIAATQVFLFNFFPNILNIHWQLFVYIVECITKQAHSKLKDSKILCITSKNLVQ